MKEPNSRWSDEPARDAEGNIIVTRPTTNDRAILFPALERYRYLPLTYLMGLTGLSYDYLGTHLNRHCRRPNKWLSRPLRQKVVQPNSHCRYLIYELAERGTHYLKDRNLWTGEVPLGDPVLGTHSLMVSETIASIEIGVKEANDGSSMIWFPEIAARLPDMKRYIPVSISKDFSKKQDGSDIQRKSFEYSNDSNGPFGIRYANGTARFFSFEAEHENQVDANNLKKTSFLKKYLAIQYIMERDLYKTLWGIPNLITLVGVPYQARIDTMKALIMRETKGKGCAHIAFHVVPLMEDDEEPKPIPEIYHTSGWQRAGYPDLHLNVPTTKKA